MRDCPHACVIPLTALTLLLTGACAGHQPAPQEAGASPAAAVCAAPGVWSEPRRLAMPDGRSVYVESEDPITTPRGLVLLGAPTWVWASRDSFTDMRFPDRDPHGSSAAGALVEHDGRVSLIAPPPGVARMMDVRVLAGDGERLHVFWGAPPDSEPAGTTAASLWHAVLDGQSWSAPVRVASADRLYLGSTTSAVAMVGGSPHMAVTASTRSPSSGAASGILYARRAVDGTWREEWIPDAADARYVALMPLGDAGVLLVYAGNSPGGGTTAWGTAAQALVARRSVSGDGRWEPPVVVRELARNDGHYLRGAHSSSGSTFVTWISQPSPENAAAGRLGSDMRGARSVDGVTWQALPPIEPGRAGPRYGMVADDAGALHVLLQEPTSGAPSSLTWRASPGAPPDDGGAWHEAPPIPHMGTLAHTGGDSLLITWPESQRWPGIPGASVPTLHYAYRAACGASAR